MSLSEKPCGICKVVKPLSEFWKNRSRKDGYKFECKDCARTYTKRWEASNREHRKSYSRKRKIETYGISVSDYEELLLVQGGVCAFCAEPCKTGRFLAVDHDHETGEVRGLLCAGCNAARVSNHTVDTARKLLDYLSNPPVRHLVRHLDL